MFKQLVWRAAYKMLILKAGRWHTPGFAMEGCAEYSVIIRRIVTSVLSLTICISAKIL
jgi:hypothetical protein